MSSRIAYKTVQSELIEVVFCLQMFSRLLSRAVDAVVQAAQTTTSSPSNKSRLDTFIDHWQYVNNYYADTHRSKNITLNAHGTV